MERIHGIIICLTKKTDTFLIEQIGKLLETGVCWHQNTRTGKTVPQLNGRDAALPIVFVPYLCRRLLNKFAWNHTAITRENRMDIQLFHALDNLSLEDFLLFIPTVRIWSAPAFQVVHFPPCQECRTGYELVYILSGVTQFLHHIFPDTLVSYGSQRHIDAVQSHPVYLFLPALPSPERHGIAERAVVEVVTEAQVCLPAFLPCHCRQDLRQLGMHLVPGKMHTGIILQVPVDS